jgi:hypothetical protein
VTGDRRCGSHSKCERIWAYVAFWASHAYKVMHTSSHCQHCGLEKLFLAGAAAARCCCASLQQLSNSGGRFAWVVSNIKLCRQKPLGLPKSARYGKVVEYYARTPILTADRARSWGSQLLGVEYGPAPGERLSSRLHPLHISLA